MFIGSPRKRHGPSHGPGTLVVVTQGREFSECQVILVSMMDSYVSVLLKSVTRLLLYFFYCVSLRLPPSMRSPSPGVLPLTGNGLPY